MVYIQPYRHWWLLADLPRKLRPGPLSRDHVLGAGQLAMVLARAAIRDPVHSALDLCCGGGVQSLHLSGHAGKVTGTDLSARALAFAATTAAINGLDWRLVRGSLIEPVAGQRFDLVVCNPPFIVGPGDVGYLYRDAGRPGDQLGAELARAAPRLLNDGGYMHYMASWAHVTGQDWTDRVASWVAGTGLDAWIVQLDRRDAAAYVRAWSPDPDAAADRARAGWLRRQRIEAISCGLITLRRSGRADPVIRTDLGCGGGQVTLQIARLVAPGGSVTGIDMDEVKLDLARRAAAERGLGNVEFRRLDVQDWDEPGGYDAVYSRFLLQHLSQPVGLLRRMWAAVRPGGVLIVEDADFDGWCCYPANEGFDFFLRTYSQVLQRRGGDHAVGRKLYACFLAAGHSRSPDLPGPAGAYRGRGKALALSTLETSAEAILSERLASEDEVTAALTTPRHFTADPRALISGPRIFQLWSRR